MKLKQLVVQGLGGFRDRVELDFETLGFTLLAGANGCGKSSVFDSVAWCLFDKTLRGVSKSDWLNDYSKQGFASLTFQDGDDLYEVKRTRDRTSCTLEVYCNAVPLFVKAPAPELQEKLEKIVLCTTFDVFRNSIMFGQEDLLTLVYGTDKERKTIIGDVLGFEEIDRCCDATRAALAVENTSVHTLEISHTEKTNTLTLYKDVSEEYLGNLRRRLNTLQLTYSQNTELLRQVEEQLGLLAQSELYDKLRADADVLARQVRTQDNRLRVLTSSFTFAATTLQVLEGDLNLTREELKTLQIQQEQVKTDLAVLKSKEKDLQVRVQQLQSVASQCPTCFQKVSDEHKSDLFTAFSLEQQKLTSTLLTRTADFDALTQEITVATLRFQEKDKKRSTYREAEKQKVDLEKELDRLSQSRLTLLQKIPQDSPTFSSTAKGDLLLRRLSLQNSQKEAEVARETLSREIGALEEKLSTRARLVSEVQTLQAALREKRHLLVHLTYLENLLSLKGVRNRVLETVLPFIEEETNSYLSLLLPTVGVEIATTRQGKTVLRSELTFNIKDLTTGTVRDFRNWSGGQKKLISLALRLALWQTVYYYSRKKLEILFLDEIFGALDEDNREVVLAFLKDRQRELNLPIIVVDHVPDVKEAFRQVIELRKEDGSCSILYKEGLN